MKDIRGFRSGLEACCAFLNTDRETLRGYVEELGDSEIRLD